MEFTKLVSSLLCSKPAAASLKRVNRRIFCIDAYYLLLLGSLGLKRGASRFFMTLAVLHGIRIVRYVAFCMFGWVGVVRTDVKDQVNKIVWQ